MAASWSRLRDVPHLDALALGCLVALAVVAPWIGTKPVYLLDWVVGPGTPVLPRPAFGLDGGITANLPRLVGAALLERLLGGVGTWLLVALAFPLAAVSLARLASFAGIGRAGRLCGALLYCVNPWVLDRVAVGHLGLLLGYALFPAFVLVVLRDGFTSWRPAVKAGLLLALLMGLSLHLVWIALPVMALNWLAQDRSWRGVRGSGVALACAGLCSAYLLVGPLAAGRTHDVPGSADLVAYQSTGDGLVELLANLVSLQGFWRPLPGEPARLIPAWPLICAGLLLVAVRGYASVTPSPGRASLVSRVVGLAGVAGLVLALGARGPLGDVFRAAYDHLPGFRVMREPQKFLALVALAYALGFGWGTDRLLRGLEAWHRRMGALALGALLLAFSPGLFWGVGGSIKPSAIPASWGQADRAMGDRDHTVLVLPWHLYLSFPFSQGRVIANPAPEVFDRLVVSGDVAELPGVPEQATSDRSAAVQKLIERGPGADISAELRALRVEYVALLRGGDWPSYSWLDAEPGLTKVLGAPDLDVWKATNVAQTDCELRHTKVHEYRANCTGKELVLEEPYDPGWRVNGHSGTRTSGGLTQFRVDPGPVTVSYEGAGRARVLLVISLAGVLILSTVLALPWRSLAVLPRSRSAVPRARGKSPASPRGS